ncbi:hypothetical protein [Tenacibaculum sp. MAR_2010_89]|uniref:hypothetical protein n=1 Tax=Tenacibaculum sp. MAR_2010_89 TaxID=1250198 RepID=UPI000B85879A|nr:hypothetical protein [Tenacibaculum sp. MAR_2010_89]
MPSTIPYDPSLVLGNIVSKQKLENIVQISKLQTPADAAESEMNSLIALKRSIDMTIQEMIGMGIDADEVIQESQQVGDQIKTAVVAYAKAKIASEKKNTAFKV